MTQETRVFKLTASQSAALRNSLNEGLPPDADWRSVPHASFSVKALGTVITCYKSGKVVLQGSDLDSFEARFLGDGHTAQAKKQAPPQLELLASTIGSDEAGKGDYFGPLVVTAFYATPDDLPKLREIGVTDSKTLSDDRARRLAGLLEQDFDARTLVVDPVSYNQRYAEAGNLNTLLAELHAEALSELLGQHDDTEVIIVDKFAHESLVAKALKRHRKSRSIETDPKLVQVTKAEQHPVVAAASILARAAFLDGLALCSEGCGSDLHKGAGTPVDSCARRIVEIGGRDLLSTVAKMHFKNTQKISGLS